jgi:hypothetical protein
MNQNYKYIISTILIFTVVIFTATAVRDDLKTLVVSLETPVQTLQTEKIKEDVQETKDVKEENIPVKTVDDYEQEEEQEYIEPEVTQKTVKQNTSNNYADYSPYLPEKPTQKSTPSTTTKTTQHATVQKSVEKPKTPTNPYQKEIDDDIFPVNIHSPNKHLRFMVFYPNTLKHQNGVFLDSMGYSINMPFNTEEERNKNYWKISGILQRHNEYKCIVRQGSEYRTSRPIDYVYCASNTHPLNEVEELAEFFQKAGYETYITDEIQDSFSYRGQNGKGVWKTYNGLWYN